MRTVAALGSIGLVTKLLEVARQPRKALAGGDNVDRRAAVLVQNGRLQRVGEQRAGRFEMSPGKKEKKAMQGCVECEEDGDGMRSVAVAVVEAKEGAQGRVG